ncbi:ogr/Delta-like zinc finger family protein [Stenotrophomonas sp.]|uniref:ogr/Delta-like zinc finger family protein n=1 Tax=Stenotrophomonas sp. TaxID=69392 RepID=UPI0028B0A007|nr:ogr/Delta-like zinc finger family protein [Stenotrophomonas sp.]
MSAVAGGRVIFSCESCDSRLIKRTSTLVHKYLRNDIYVCDNPLCGASYSGHSELTGIASPSGVPTALPSELPPTPSFLRAQMQLAWKAGKGYIQLDLLDAIDATVGNRGDKQDAAGHQSPATTGRYDHALPVVKPPRLR